jgi:cytochrome c biogenesis protein CcdA
MNTKKIILFSLLACLLFSGCLRTQVRTIKERSVNNKHKLLVFHSINCQECIKVKNTIMPQIQREFQDKIQIEYRDTAVEENYKLLLSLKEKYNNKIELVLPVFYFEGQLLNAKAEVKNNLRRMIAQSLSKPPTQQELPAIDLLEHFKSFKIFGIIAAGLGDGVNPCAFTVIVFFISYLALQGYRKKELTAIGFSFILAVFLTYLLIGFGLFNIIYSLDKFLLVRKVFNISIGIFSLTLGVLSYYDLVTFKKTKDSKGLILQLPETVKKRIHAIIGWHYRKPKGQEGRVSKPHIFRLIISALVTGFLVSFLELVCTGQLYLPTIKFALKTTPLKLQALGYLLLYNLMFIMPLLIIFILALLGVTSEQFSKMLKKHIVSLKALMTILFFSLGIVLIWRP